MFHVEWRAQAQISLLEIWLLADTALLSPLRDAINELERRLASAPLDEGEIRQGSKRVAFESPLGIDFSVDDEKKLVKVAKVWLVRRH